jgi:aspartyl-tRNA(Asn)/glutamyl-tRNA(Gln) amidotransferase subunit A
VTAAPAELTLAEVSLAIRRRELTSTRVARDLLERIQRLQPRVNSYIAIEAEAALASAERADREIEAGRWRGPLHGVPLAHKDAFDRKGRVTTVGSKSFERPAAATATVIERLDEAGAVNLGALNLDEFAAGGTGANEHFGRCRNPWNLDHVTGGSSGGSAAAVAARLAYGALGGDAGGSIRLPAALCGVVGLKPTFGRVSRSGTAARTWSMDCTGPLARTAEDCALMLRAIAGADPEDPTTQAVPVPDYGAELARGVAGLRIGVAVGEPFERVEPETQGLLEDALAAFRDLGAATVPVRLSGVAELTALHQVMVKSEAAAIVGRLLRTRAKDISFPAASVLYEGFLIPATRYLEACSLRGTLLEEFLEDAFGKADLLFLPATSGPAPSIAETQVADGGAVEELFARAAEMTRFANYLGTPAISVPCGFSANGLPVGFQLLGPPFAEDLLLAAAHAYQSRTDHHRRAPPL